MHIRRQARGRRGTSLARWHSTTSGFWRKTLRSARAKDGDFQGEVRVARRRPFKRAPDTGDGRVKASTGVTMGKIDDLEQQVQALSSEELAQFRAWFLEFDWAAWDTQIERDIRGGGLDGLAEKALRDHTSGQTRPL